MKRVLVRAGIIAVPVALLMGLPNGWWKAVLAVFVAGQLVTWAYVTPRRVSAEQ